MVNGPFKEPGAPSPFSPLVAESAFLPNIMPKTQAHAGIYLGLAIALVLMIVLSMTPFGYHIDTVGQNPIAVVFTSFFFGALHSGANVMQRSAEVPFTIIYAIQGLTVLFVAIALAVMEFRDGRISRFLPLRSGRNKPVQSQ